MLARELLQDKSYLLRDLIDDVVGRTADNRAVGLNDDVVFFAIGSDFALLEVRVELSTKRSFE